MKQKQQQSKQTQKQMRRSKEEELDTGNAFDKLVNEQWKSEEDYKRTIVALELQNEKYRNQLYELGETVNKILQKTKVPQSNKNNLPNLDQQLQLVKKQLHNVNQFIEIYQRQLDTLGGKKENEQMESIAQTQQLLKEKMAQLNQLKKQVKQITHKNKGLQYKLLQYNKRNKAKSLDQQALQLKQLVNENKNLKSKLEQLQNMQQKKQEWLKNNIRSAKQLEQKVKKQQSALPKIQSRGSLREKSLTQSLPKLQSQKKIYQKWLQTSRAKSNSRIDKQLEDLTKVNEMVLQKIKNVNQEINSIKQSTKRLRQKVEANEGELIEQEVDDGVPKNKQMGVMAAKKLRKVRREWIGKFDTLRFSDSRTIREQTRIYKVLFNTAGYYQFFYYSAKDYKKTYVGKLPFDPNSLTIKGAQSTFTVQYPDFIKNMKIKLNIKNQKFVQVIATSNLGLQGIFNSNIQIQTVTQMKEGDKQGAKKPKQQANQSYFQMDIKSNEAITCMFGSYGIKTDDKKNITAVWLQGLGVELIEDFVQEMI